MFKGYYTALLTPFKENKIDESAYQQLIEKQIVAKVSGIVPCGTTGEAPTLSVKEHFRLFDLAKEAAQGKIKIMGGTGSNCTDHAIESTKYAQKLGQDAVLSIVPYGNKPTQNGIYHHFKAIHDATDIPIILYNVPGRTVVKLEPETAVALAKLPRIAGIKDCSCDMAYPLKLKELLPSSKKFALLTGEDLSAAAYMAHGGDGVISVTSNIAPELCMKMYDAWVQRDIDTFMKTNQMLFPLSEAMFCETSPAPVKYAASLLDLCHDEIRLPLTTISDDHKELIMGVMNRLNLISPTHKAMSTLSESSGFAYC